MTKQVQIRRYETQDAGVWNDFVATSSNGTFLHNRHFMEYHADRFRDHSLIVEREGKIVALLPADRVGTTLRSHGGLTYGGFITGERMSAQLMIDILASLGGVMMQQGLTQLRYKPVPHLFHRYPAEHDIYALVQAGASLVRCDLSSAIAIGRSPRFSKSKRQGVQRARKAGLDVGESTDFNGFWEILSDRLETAHDAAPTHSLAEINRLRAQFAGNIRLFVATQAGDIQGGLVIFDCGQAVHVQYMATTEQGRTNGALDLIIATLLDTEFADRSWFNFGISTVNGGTVLNTGLARQKEMFGASSIVFNEYQLDIT